MVQKEPKLASIYQSPLYRDLLKWFLILSILPLLIITTVNYYQVKSNLEQFAIEEAYIAGESRKNYFNNWFQSRIDNLNQLANTPVTSRLLTTLEQQLQQFDGNVEAFVKSSLWQQTNIYTADELALANLNHDYIDDTYIIDKKGNVLFSMAQEADLGTSLATGEYQDSLFADAVKLALDTGAIVFSDIERYTPSEGMLTAFIATPIFSKGEVHGVLASQVKLDALYLHIKALNKKKPSLQQYILGTDGKLRSSLTQNLEDDILTELPASDLFTQFNNSSNVSAQSNKHYLNNLGEPVIGYATPLNIANVTWLYVTEIKRADALNNASQLLYYSLILLVIGTFLVTYLANRKSSAFIKPILQLVEYSKLVAKGKNVTEVNIDAKYEISLLANSFNDMLIAQRKHESLLIKSQSETINTLRIFEHQQFAIDQHCIVTITNQAGVIEYVNDKFTEISGYSETELLGNTHKILNSGYHGKSFFVDMYKVITAGKIWHGEIRNKAKDGSFYWVNTTIVPFLNDENLVTRYIAIRTDVTENKSNQNALVQSKEQHESLIKNMPGITYRCLYDNDWTMLFMSEQCVAITGYTVEQLLNNNELTFAELIASDYQKHVEDIILNAIKSGLPWTVEYKIETRFKESRWLSEKGNAVYDSEGNILYLEGFIVDITQRKESQKEMAKLSQIAAQTDNAVVLTDIAGKTEWVNDAFTIITGYSLSDVIGQSPGHILQGELSDKATIERMRLALELQQPFEETLINYHKNGRPYWISISCKPIIDDRNEVTGFMALEVDVTAKKEIEDKVRLQKRLLENMSEQAKIGAWEANLIEGSIYWSPMTRMIHEVDNDYAPELSGAINFYKEGDSRDKIIKVVEQSMSTQMVWREELQIITAKGREVWVLAHGESSIVDGVCVRLFGSFQDINDRKLAEITALEEANQNKVLAQLNVNDAVLSGDVALSKNTIIQSVANVLDAERVSLWVYKPELEALECLSLYEKSKDAFSEGALLTKKDFPEYFAAISSEALISIDDAHTHPATRDCSEAYLTPLNISSLIDGIFSIGDGMFGVLSVEQVGDARHWNEHEQRFIMSISTLTSSIFSAEQRRIAESKLLIAKDEAEAAVAAKSEFLATMSHEIRTPMNGVLGMLELLEEDGLTKEQLRKAQVAKSSAHSLLGLINEILDFSRLDAGKMELESIDFDLSALVGDTSLAVAFMAQEKGLELVLDLSQINDCMVKGDPAKLRQILTNLLGNAIKFTESGEIKVTVSTSNLSQNNTGQKQPDKNENMTGIHIEVSDSGIGIPRLKQEQLFEPFTQVDASTTRRFGGSGLGLAICHKIITLMDGTITVSSVEGQGSIFSIDLQLIQSDIVTQPLPSLELSGVEVLIVENNKSSCSVLQRQLEKWGAIVYTALSSEQALSLCDEKHAKKQGKAFDIALINKQLADINGVELGELLRSKQNSKNIPLAIMTNLGTKDDANYVSSLGFSGYFTKPIIANDLISTLSFILQCGDLATPSLNQATRLSNTKSDIKTTKASIPLESNLSQVEDTQSDKIKSVNKYKILLVEDNKVNQQVADFMLTKLGYEFELAENGLEAVTILSNKQDHFDLILMDCQMPEMDGYQATRHVREDNAGKLNQTIPIIALTANAMEGDKEKCLAAGMDDYLSKPIQLAKLKKILEEYLF
ncbi:hypothetical protein GCM10008107_02460 [Psychrosphaera saromensis]|uniref:histidine kinase n=1 Tax=Psychrosphaera saromensis TaxID=716813 RepID=A0A2S7UYK6_9GAMM|nr:PAS domain S-box protein [Psychrosphaera saromensis]PQJ54795.1 hypothetical protein BTO11_14815 [Psychrosphaera saromensis]GHB57068.1 hypothetical protein GCM10008107_02460 [Psychrosphaera saromensis]GLQ13968.1 hypothetical protein GCM10007917_14230 [Psychrosphaera saromensis]